MATKGKKIEHVFTGMEIDEGLDFHIKAWKIQPIAWSVIGLFVLAGVLGLFGTGLLSKTSKQQGKVVIKYERFFRFGTPMKLEVRDGTGAPETKIIFPTAYLSRFSIQSIVPQPDETEISGGLMTYSFNSGTPGRQVFFYLEPQQPGTSEGAVRVNKEQIYLSQFIYP
jgi:hypothetical protein